jgi:predicted N-acetyltransferase YhbS
VAQQYEASLVQGSAYYLVAGDDRRVIASGGLSYQSQDRAVLCFGLVHPSQQGRGIGTALVLARLSLLKPNRTGYHVFVFAVEDSFGFYRRFGFRDFQAWRDPQGDTQPSGHLFLTCSEIRRCRALLKDHSITVPEDEGQIPVRMKAV